MSYLRRTTWTIALFFCLSIQAFTRAHNHTHYSANAFDAVLAEIDSKLSVEVGNRKLLICRAILYHTEGSVVPSGDIWTVYDTQSSDVEGIAAFAFYLNRQSMFKASLAYFDMYLKKKPTMTRGYLGKGGALIKLERYEEAVSVLEKGLWLKPDNPHYWHLLLEAYYYAGRSDRVGEYIEKFDRWIKKDGSIIRNGKSWAQFPFRYENAILSLSTDLEPQEHTILYYEQLSMLYYKLNMKEAACKMANKVYAQGYSQNLRHFPITCTSLYLEVGSRLEYKLNYYGKKSTMTLLINSYDENGISLDWYSTLSTDQKGSKHMRFVYLDRGNALSFILNNEKDEEQEQAVFFWFPRKAFKQLRDGKKVSLRVDGNMEEFKVEASGHIGVDYKYSERHFPILHIVSASGKYVDVVNDPDNPLIVQSNFGRKMKLTKVE